MPIVSGGGGGGTPFNGGTITAPLYIAPTDATQTYFRVSSSSGRTAFQIAAAAGSTDKIGPIDFDSGENDVTFSSEVDGTTIDLALDNVLLSNNTAGSKVRFDSKEVFWTRSTAAPTDGDLIAGAFGLWLDATNGAAKLMIYAKQADGTVRTAAIALT